ncbi:MAG TPA: DUF1810 domain-containing protein [Hyphomicrobium sp.]|nr:DUF1810 domain-containing protein [Hyphomicrobium sp.]
MGDPFDLQRFVDAQSLVYETVLRELRDGRKTTHWIWFIFPQAKGLGRSAMSELYAISSLDEARAYLAHPVLGTRLKQCTELVLAHKGVPLEEILGELDAMKFRSSMELFHEAGAAFTPLP